MRRQHHRAFILLMILVLLALVAAALAALCRSSLRDTLASTQAEDDLQQRWGALSCQTLLLPRVELLLQQAEATSHQPVAIRELHFTLGKQDFAVWVADETAKLNLNFIYQQRNRAEAERAADVAARTAGDRLRVELRPSEVSPPLQSFGQIFISAGDALSPLDVQRVTTEITCWGDGKLNWHRASPGTLAAQCGGPMGIAAVRRLVALQAVSPAPTLGDLLVDPQIARADQGALVGKLLADQSNCHSIWVVSHAAEGRASYDLAILDHSGDGPARTICFSW